MNRFLTRILVPALLILSSRERWNLATDKAAHFGLSSVAVEASMRSCQYWQDTGQGRIPISPTCRWAASALVLSAGILKEVSDQRRGRRFDSQDLVADVLGVTTGQLLQWEF